jgi:putative serine protease PepD
MSDEQREQGRDTGSGSRPDQHPGPSHDTGPTSTTYPEARVPQQQQGPASVPQQQGPSSVPQQQGPASGAWGSHGGDTPAGPGYGGNNPAGPGYGSTPGYGSGPGYSSGAGYGSGGYGGNYGGAGYGSPYAGSGSGGYAAAGQAGPPPHTPGPGDTLATPQPPHRRRGMGAVVTAAVLAGLIGGGGGFAGAYALLDNGGTTHPTLTSAPATGAVATTPGSVAAAAQTASPSTVDIRVRLAQGEAEGSGVILTADGNILTNNHVVAGATGDITVTLADGSEHAASVVGVSPSYDLAVLKMQGVSGLPPATLGNSGDLQVGQQVVAIGSPQGLSGTVTTGIVSAFDRTVQVQGEDGSGVVYNGLQTDAPINQGNSGGPLVNLQGQVVGINSAIATAGDSSGSIGLGFAIPIDQAKRVAQEILASGTATKPVLGVRGDASGSGGAGVEGAQLGSVDDGSPAATAGLKQGDVVTKVDNAAVQSFADLIARIGAHNPGDKVSLTVGTGGSAHQVEVTLGSVADRAATTSSGGQSQNPFGSNGNPFGGGNGGGGGGGGNGGNGGGNGGGGGLFGN